MDVNNQVHMNERALLNGISRYISRRLVEEEGTVNPPINLIRSMYLDLQEKLRGVGVPKMEAPLPGWVPEDALLIQTLVEVMGEPERIPIQSFIRGNHRNMEDLLFLGMVRQDKEFRAFAKKTGHA